MEAKEIINLPMLIDQDEDWVWVAVSPIFKWFNTQWYDLNELKENLEDISWMYFDMIREGEKPFKSKYFINLTYNKDGKITNNFSKEINQDFGKVLIWA